MRRTLTSKFGIETEAKNEAVWKFAGRLYGTYNEMKELNNTDKLDTDDIALGREELSTLAVGAVDKWRAGAFLA